MSAKVSIRFFDDREVRAVWDDARGVWYFSVLDIIGAIRKEPSYEKCRNYWKYLKAKLKKEGHPLIAGTVRMKFKARDGKQYSADALDADGVVLLTSAFPGHVASAFIAWFMQNADSIDGKSKQKAYALFESSLADSIEVGTFRGLRQIHAYLFGGLYDFAGKMRGLNIAKGGFAFVPAMFLQDALRQIESMPETTLPQIVRKYIEMNVAHPFLEGNGRSTRIWLDLMLKKRLGVCVDWSRIDKGSYMDAMRRSPVDGAPLQQLIADALTDRIDDREVFLKGIDTSYDYEED